MATNIFARLRAGITTSSADDTRALAEELAAVLPPEATVALHGDLGVGKTTFVQGLARGLGVLTQVTSPTFAIYSVYRGRPRTLLHLDAYRLEDEREIEALLLDDFLVSPWCLAVEWPDKVAGWLPADALHITFSIEGAERHRVKLR